MSDAPVVWPGPERIWFPYRAKYHDLAAGDSDTVTNSLSGVVVFVQALDVEIAALAITGSVLLVGPGPCAVSGVKFEGETNLAVWSWRGMLPIATGETFQIQNLTGSALDYVATGIVIPVALVTSG